MQQRRRSAGALSVGAAAIQFGIFWALVLALTNVGLWSLAQTILYTKAAFGDVYGPWIGILVQFWQNFAIFMANRAKTTKEKALWWISWGLSALLDATTNVGQYHEEHAGLMDAKPMLYWMAQTLCVLTVGVEEALSWALAAALHKTNDLIEAIWGTRFELLEWAETGVKQAAPQFSGAGRKPASQPVQAPKPAPVSVPRVPAYPAAKPKPASVPTFSAPKPKGNGGSPPAYTMPGASVPPVYPRPMPSTRFTAMPKEEDEDEDDDSTETLGR